MALKLHWRSGLGQMILIDFGSRGPKFKVTFTVFGFQDKTIHFFQGNFQNRYD
jgi:hypothetical protein